MGGSGVRGERAESDILSRPTLLDRPGARQRTGPQPRGREPGSIALQSGRFEVAADAAFMFVGARWHCQCIEAGHGNDPDSRCWHATQKGDSLESWLEGDATPVSGAQGKSARGEFPQGRRAKLKTGKKMVAARN